MHVSVHQGSSSSTSRFQEGTGLPRSHNIVSTSSQDNDITSFSVAHLFLLSCFRATSHTISIILIMFCLEVLQI